MSVNTKKVADRRTIRFNTIDEILADAESMTAGPIRTSGNWTSAQIIQHVADLMHASLDGLDHIKLSLPIRLMGRVIKPFMLKGKMPPGVKAPKQLEQYMPSTAADLNTAMERLRSAASRYRTERTTHPSPFLGPMTHEDWVKLHCRHAEMHFSFMHRAE